LRLGLAYFAGDLLDNVKSFLEVEKQEIRKKTSSRSVYWVTITQREQIDDLYYSFLSTHDFRLEEGLWVEIICGDYLTFGALWYSEKKGYFYVITEQEITANHVGLREADEYQLVLMQEEAINFVIQGKTKKAELLKTLINQKIQFPKTELRAMEFFDTDLNIYQKDAVQHCCSLSLEDTFHLIQGPPGTGKTTVITEIVRNLQKQGKKVLITSHTNVAVDNVLEKICKEPILAYQSSIIRLGNKTNVSERLKELVPVRADETIALGTSQIVGATLSKVSMLIKLGKLTWDEPFFDYVIIDESSMATIPLTLIGVLCGKKFVLVGDHKQLPPITTPAASRLVSEKWESLFRVLHDKYLNKHTLLDIQYRSHPTIMGFSSTYFYDDKIQSDSTCQNKILNISTPQNENIPGTINSRPMLHIDTCRASNLPPIGRVAISSNPQDTKSYLNEYEAAVALAIWTDLLKAGVNPNNICIITPFKLQAQILIAAMKKAVKTIQTTDSVTDWRSAASTVHKFQGKEKEVVIYCITWSPTYDDEPLHIALKDFRELNVALTRASKKLIVVGSLAEIGYFPYNALAEFCEKRKLTVSCPQIEKTNPFLKLVNDCFSQRDNLRSETSTQISYESPKETSRAPEKKPTPQRDNDGYVERVIRYYLNLGLTINEISTRTCIPKERIKEFKDKIENKNKPTPQTEP
jgi:superfamily I DNA and/or RNA helicase